MDLATALLVVVVCTVIVLRFTNGFHDAADMVATAIATTCHNPSFLLVLMRLLFL